MEKDFLAFKYRGTNLGDDIQTIALMRLMPEGASPSFIERDKLSRSSLKGKLVLGGWWGHDPEGSLPVPEGIEALPVSMHLNAGMRRYMGTLSILKHGRVGARDLSTLDFLKANGADAYFSDCMTLTLEKHDGPRSGVILCDLKPKEQAIAKRYFPKAVVVSHFTPHTISDANRRIAAESLLKMYASASLVITGRLHAALPSVAMGTPAILCHHADDPRFTGYADTLPVVHPKDLDEAIRSHLVAPFVRSDQSFMRAEELKSRIKSFLC